MTWVVWDPDLGRFVERPILPSTCAAPAPADQPAATLSLGEGLSIVEVVPGSPAQWEDVDRVPSDFGAVRRVSYGVDEPSPAIDEAHLARQRAWSRATFGPGDRLRGVLDHITRELVEVEQADPSDRLAEWVDVVILALDGAWRSGATPAEIIAAVKAKQARNEARSWPDWRTADPDRAIEHVRADTTAADAEAANDTRPIA